MTPQREVLVDGLHLASLTAHDRGLLYGDGVFRTLRVDAGVPRWWDEQLEKLSVDCERIGLMAPDATLWRADFDQIATHGQDGVLKLLVTRGSGPRGYFPPPQQPVRRVMYFDSCEFNGVSGAGLTLRTCALRLAWQPRLAGVKHLNRLENVLARAEWTSPDIHEGLLLDQADRVIGGVMSNLFVWRERQLLTPRLDQCGVAGVTRARLLRRAKQHGIEVRETDLTMQAVIEADEVMLTNSVQGLRRVARLDGKIWLEPVISPSLAEWLNA